MKRLRNNVLIFGFRIFCCILCCLFIMLALKSSCSEDKVEVKIDKYEINYNAQKVSIERANNARYLAFVSKQEKTVTGKVKDDISYINFGEVVEDFSTIKMYHVKNRLDNLTVETDEYGIVYLKNQKAYKFDFTTMTTSLISDNCKAVFSSTEAMSYGVLKNDGSIKIYGEKSNFHESNISNVWYINNYIVYVKDGNLYLNGDDTTLIHKNCGTVVALSLFVENNNEPTIIYADSVGNVYGYGKNRGHAIIAQKDEELFFKEPQVIFNSLRLEEIYCEYGSVWAKTSDDKLVFWGALRNDCGFVYSDELIYVDKRIDSICLVYEDDKFRKQPTIVGLDTDKKLNKITVSCEEESVNRRTVNVTIGESENPISYITEKIFIDNNQLIVDANAFSDFRVSVDSVLCGQSWIDWDYNVDSVVSDIAFLVDKNVDRISGSMYSKNKHVYRFTSKHLSKEVKVFDFGVKDIFYSHDIRNSCGLMYDGNNNIWFIKPKGYLDWDYDYDVMFFYKYYNLPSSFAVKQPEIVEHDVDRFWASPYGVAFVKDGNLYAHGTWEKLRCIDKGMVDEHFEYKDFFELPFKLVKFKGIDVEKIKKINFSYERIYIIMKDGITYNILPKQPSWRKIVFRDMTDDDVYTKVRSVNQNDAIKNKRFKDYTKNYTIDINGNAEIKCGNTIRSFKNVKKVMVGGYKDICFVLKKNGNLIGWGYNGVKTIDKRDNEFVSFENRKLIAKNVRDFSMRGTSLFYLDKNGNLYFRGKFDPLIVRDYAERM